ncbi:MAG: hypothetical protein RL490_2833 [Pseudomonadota bacterium]|jgi:uncharacterized protein (DUF1330 family)
MFSLLLLLAAAPPVTPPPPGPAALAPAVNADVCDGKPVIMLVSGLVHDRDRILRYGEAIRASGLYEKLGGYYIASPRSIATFEGSPPPNQSVLMVRFPCYAHARRFWYSEIYQKQLVPLRQNPSAGDFTVTIYPEIPPPPAVAAQLNPGGYKAVPSPDVAASIPVVSTEAPKQ